MQKVTIETLPQNQPFKLSPLHKMQYKLVEHISSRNEYHCCRTDAQNINIYLQPGHQVLIQQPHEN